MIVHVHQVVAVVAAAAAAVCSWREKNAISRAWSHRLLLVLSWSLLLCRPDSGLDPELRIVRAARARSGCIGLQSN